MSKAKGRRGKREMCGSCCFFYNLKNGMDHCIFHENFKSTCKSYSYSIMKYGKKGL